MDRDRALHDFRDLVRMPEIDLAAAALAVARIEYPDLAPERSLAKLDDLAARSRVPKRGDGRRAVDRLRLPVRRARVSRERRRLLRPSQQLPQRRPRSPAR